MRDGGEGSRDMPELGQLYFPGAGASRQRRRRRLAEDSLTDPTPEQAAWIREHRPGDWWVCFECGALVRVDGALAHAEGAHWTKVVQPRTPGAPRLLKGQPVPDPKNGRARERS